MRFVCVSDICLQGADIVVTDMDGKTALHWTANNTDPSTTLALLELAPTAVNLKDSEGRTGSYTQPLMTICFYVWWFVQLFIWQWLLVTHLL